MTFTKDRAKLRKGLLDMLAAGDNCPVCELPFQDSICHPQRAAIVWIIPRSMGGPADTRNWMVMCDECANARDEFDPNNPEKSVHLGARRMLRTLLDRRSRRMKAKKEYWLQRQGEKVDE